MRTIILLLLFSNITYSQDTLFLKVWDWVNADSIDYQFNYNLPGYGIRAEFKIIDNCENPSSQSYHFYLWSNEVKKIIVSNGECLSYHLHWFPPSPVAPQIGWPAKVGIFADPECMYMVYPGGTTPMTFWPLFYLGWNWQNPSIYIGSQEGRKTIYLPI